MNFAESAAPAVMDSSLWGMFWAAPLIVKAVMVGLFGASVWCWAIILHKILLYARMRKSLDQFEQVFWAGPSLEELYRTLTGRETHGIARLFMVGMREWKHSLETPAGLKGVENRIEKALDMGIQREMESLEAHLLTLATVASASPFVGLFGTVWGIMTSFQAIALSKNTSLAVVAPGISEALLATAMGLFAAIPALIAYNKLQGDVARIQARLETFADELSAILARQTGSQIFAERGKT